MAAEKVVIQLILDEGDVASGLKDLTGKFTKAGKKSGDSFEKGLKKANPLAGIKKSLLSTKTLITGVVASIGTAFATGKLIGAANEQEDAINRLNSSLKITGQFSEETSASLQAFASDLQAASVFGDELILNQLALAQSFGATAEQSKDVVSAAADLSAAFGIDLESATRNVSKTLGGYAGELGEVLPELKSLSQEQLRAGAGVDLLAKKFAGFASSQIKTFSGATKQLNNTFGDLLEEFGFLITQNPIITKAVNTLSKGFLTLGSTVKKNQGTLKELVAIGFVQVVNGAVFVAKSVIGIQKAFVLADREINKFIDNQTNQAGKLAVQAGKALEDGNRELFEKLNAQSKIIGEVEERERLKREESYKKRLLALDELKTGITNLASEINTSVQTSIQDGLGNQENDPVRQTILGWSEALNSFGSGFTDVGFKVSTASTAIERAQENIKNANKQLQASFVNLGKASKNALANGVGQGFAAVGRALVEGQNAFDAFAKAFISTIGQVAIQQGTAFILQGIGYSFIPSLQPLAAGLIGAGAALATFGGAISAFANKGSPATRSASGGVNISPDNNDTTSDPLSNIDSDEIAERSGPSSSIVVNVDGDVVSEDEFGTRLVDIINKSIDNTDVKFRQGAFA